MMWHMGQNDYRHLQLLIISLENVQKDITVDVLVLQVLTQV